jgi:hypothetical protein
MTALLIAVNGYLRNWKFQYSTARRSASPSRSLWLTTGVLFDFPGSTLPSRRQLCVRPARIVQFFIRYVLRLVFLF